MPKSGSWKSLVLALLASLMLLSGGRCRYSGKASLCVDESQTYQQMVGFGASLTDSSGWLIDSVLTPAQRADLMETLFSVDNGIGLSFLRQPMGASDFALSSYTYADVPDDWNLANFSIAHDQAYLIPLLQEALALNPSLSLMGTPWSAPAWMKLFNLINAGPLRDDAYDVYADYFVRYVQAYEAAGLPIHSVTLQNEPNLFVCAYPCMWMVEADQARLAQLVGDRFQQNGITSKILIFDHNWDAPDFAIAVLDDPSANPHIAGSAFHCYAGAVTAQSQVQAAHPDKEIYLTECSGGLWSTDFGNNLTWDVSNLIIGGTRNWAKTVAKWNLALDENNGPTNGGCSNCRGVVTIDSTTGSVTKNVEYYSLGHASKFVMPGAWRIASGQRSGGGIETVAFENPDGSFVLIVLNSEQDPQTEKIRWRGQGFVFQVPARSVVSFVWDPAPNAVVQAWITTGDRSKLLEPQPTVSMSNMGPVCQVP